MKDGHAVLARLAGVRRSYGAIEALAGIDLEVRGGQMLALLGPNGAGKSTAVGLLLGQGLPDAGTVSLFGRSPHELAARRRVGVMLQSAGIPDTLKVSELLALTRSYYPNPRSIADCVMLAGLDGLLERRYRQLSGGQQRRVQFALSVCGRPQLLFLDEPTTGMDIEARRTLWRAIRELVADGCGVLLTTHYLEEAEALADRVAVLQRGRLIAEGSVEDLRGHLVQRRIRCLSALSVERVSAWPHVMQAHRDDARLELVTDAAEAVVRRLLTEDPALTGLEVQRAGLSDAFLELTREDAREAA
ncbi:ABC transporter ATP-binding protein [Lysobacter sp. LF1]|uniref:ABC transporter ATP-binding protein n=1 Tax=Lysobacter stagni TaxID=3045172 RepID=A0ABT6XEG8_9GAMM|nr:ABC transporter ATP-binding protein [Lysobacter sp. LF1]MDI9238541.1 ABC transporter ATP-binding protein [Lysobacter sp. LF1]